MSSNNQDILNDSDENIKKWHLPDVNSNQSIKDCVNVVDNIAESNAKSKSDGYEQGFQQGYAEGKAKLDQAVLKLSNIISSLNQPILRLDQQVEEELLELVMCLTKQILQKELKSNTEHLKNVIIEAKQALPSSSSKVKVYFNPDDLSLVNEVLKEELEINDWTLLGDANLSCGDCRITTDTVQVDATLDTKLNNILEQMTDGTTCE